MFQNIIFYPFLVIQLLFFYFNDVDNVYVYITMLRYNLFYANKKFEFLELLLRFTLSM